MVMDYNEQFNLVVKAIVDKKKESAKRSKFTIRISNDDVSILSLNKILSDLSKENVIKVNKINDGTIRQKDFSEIFTNTKEIFKCLKKYKYIK